MKQLRGMAVEWDWLNCHSVIRAQMNVERLLLFFLSGSIVCLSDSVCMDARYMRRMCRSVLNLAQFTIQILWTFIMHTAHRLAHVLCRIWIINLYGQRATEFAGILHTLARCTRTTPKIINIINQRSRRYFGLNQRRFVEIEFRSMKRTYQMQLGEIMGSQSTCSDTHIHTHMLQKHFSWVAQLMSLKQEWVPAMRQCTMKKLTLNDANKQRTCACMLQCVHFCICLSGDSIFTYIMCDTQFDDFVRYLAFIYYNL